jgi:ribosomal protein S18 acetylase RimI-like enzyme
LALPCFRVERMTAAHDVSRFRSGNTDLDHWLKHKALINQKQNLIQTYLLIDPTAAPADNVAGYIALRAGQQWSAGISEAPDSASPIHIPVVEIANLARHIRLKGESIGDILLIEALRIVVSVANQVGVAGAYLVANEEGLKLYQEYGFSLYKVKPPWQMFLPIVDCQATLYLLGSGPV